LAHPSPLDSLHAAGEALFGHYGPAAGGIQIVEAFDPVEVEYASVRRHAAVFDQPHTGILEIRGEDRLGFLNRMLTQDLKDFPPYRTRAAFWLSRKGRISGDLRLVALPDRVLALGDVFAAARTRQELGQYIITEDVTITDLSASMHVLSLHGPAAAAVLAGRSTHTAGSEIAAIGPGDVASVLVDGLPVTAARHDSTGEIGLSLVMAAADAATVYEAISTPWSAREAGAIAAPQTALARRIGWHALNMARIEAGAAQYMLDFGPDSLPHETGDETLHDRVSFKKGCYLGQEIVARMHSLGHPKQKLVGLRVATAPPDAAGNVPQAVTGTTVLDADQPGATVVGAVTSSAFSPMNGGAAVCFAMVKFSHSTAGKAVWLQTDGARLGATVQASLSFLQRTPGAVV
jgi:folate-binding protein YgfZ